MGGVPQGFCSERIGDIINVEMNRSVVDELVKIPECKKALDDLDIEHQDHRRLAEILDYDHSGTIDVFEFVNGLLRLRGQPRRSDIVSIDLMVRSLQTLAQQISEDVYAIKW